jgi:hypothetical protein
MTTLNCIQLRLIAVEVKASSSFTPKIPPSVKTTARKMTKALELKATTGWRGNTSLEAPKMLHTEIAKTRTDCLCEQYSVWKGGQQSPDPEE